MTGVMNDVRKALRPAMTAVALLAFAGPVAAQTAPAAAPPQPDGPSIRLGAVIFADYTVQQRPTATDVDGNIYTPNAFNVGRAYLNVTGSLSKLIGFRITPDIVRESGSGSSLSGSQTFRLKYAYAQFNLDEWLNRGSWVRVGMQQTPWIDFIEGVYRYRFQGTIFEDREGFLSSSDVGLSFRYSLGGNYGDLHTGIYNGETYSRPEANDQKGFMIRGTVRPMPEHAVLGGLRLTGFVDRDAYVRSAERRRAIAAVTFEHRYVNAGFHYLAAADQLRASAAEVDARGYSLWVTSKTTTGWGGVLRLDRLEPDTTLEARKTRTIAGVAYWFPTQGGVSSALMLDLDHVKYDRYIPARNTERRYAAHLLISF